MVGWCAQTKQYIHIHTAMLFGLEFQFSSLRSYLKGNKPLSLVPQIGDYVNRELDWENLLVSGSNKVAQIKMPGLSCIGPII